jgi:apolipoprotein N-acyltransferase
MIGAPKPLAAFLGIFAVSFIAAVHGSQFAVAAWLWDEKRWRGKLWLMPLVIAGWWQFFDYARCIPPLAHIWGALAFTQWRDTALLQVLPFVGQHGLTALLVWCGASLALWAKVRRASFVLAPLCAFFALHGLGMWQLFNQSASATFASLLVSTDVPSLRKSGLAEGETPFQQAQRLTMQANVEGLVAVWPETTLEVSGIGEFWTTDEIRGTSLRALLTTAKSINGSILTGAHYHHLSPLELKLQNVALMIDASSDSPSGQEIETAPKIRTVPFGEKAPLGEWLPFLRNFAPKPEITPGDQPTVLGYDFPLGTLICFESCFPDPARALVKKGAKILFVLTNDEWFRGTNAPWEHAAMAVIRAAENRVPVAQVANGGYTLLVDSRGRILHQSFGAGATPVSIPLN